MHDFVHLHVHTQYSILDGQASVSRLVDKAMKDGMRGMAITDHGNMMAIKEFFNYTNKKNGPVKGEIKALKQKIKALKGGRNVASEEWDALPALWLRDPKSAVMSDLRHTQNSPDLRIRHENLIVVKGDGV